jgi:hypothetical protein
MRQKIQVFMLFEAYPLRHVDRRASRRRHDDLDRKKKFRPLGSPEIGIVWVCLKVKNRETEAPHELLLMDD